MLHCRLNFAQITSWGIIFVEQILVSFVHSRLVMMRGKERVKFIFHCRSSFPLLSVLS